MNKRGRASPISLGGHGLFGVKRGGNNYYEVAIDFRMQLAKGEGVTMRCQAYGGRE